LTLEYKILQDFPDLILYGDSGDKLMGLRNNKNDAPLDTATKVEGSLFDVDFEIYFCDETSKDEHEGPISFLDFMESLKAVEVNEKDDSE
jgi:hypothetical protein